MLKETHIKYDIPKQKKYNKSIAFFVIAFITSFVSLYLLFAFYKFYFIPFLFQLKLFLGITCCVSLLLIPFLKKVFKEEFAYKSTLLIGASLAVHLVLFFLLFNASFLKVKTQKIALKPQRVTYSGEHNSYYVLINYKSIDKRIYIEEKDKEHIASSKQITLTIDSCYFGCEFYNGYTSK